MLQLHNWAQGRTRTRKPGIVTHIQPHPNNADWDLMTVVYPLPVRLECDLDLEGENFFRDELESCH